MLLYNQGKGNNPREENKKMMYDLNEMMAMGITLEELLKLAEVDDAELED